jgi:hypothetical protein
VTLTVGSLVLAAGQQTPVTTAVTAGISGTTGGFLCEATRGTFIATSGNHINGTGGSITHSDRTRRTWSYTYTAPATPGPVELTSAALTANNNGSDSGDKFSFTGFDPNATVGTPVRLYVLPAGLTNLGNPCSDGYANRPVLGALTSPTIGNGGFQFHLIGTAPASYALLLLGINPPAFPGVPLDIIGINGCTGYVASPVVDAVGDHHRGQHDARRGLVHVRVPDPELDGLRRLHVRCARRGARWQRGRDAPVAVHDEQRRARRRAVRSVKHLHPRR